MIKTSYIEPAALVPQDDTPAAAEARRNLALLLVLDGPAGRRAYEVDADNAWAHYNDAYDHAAAEWESPADADSAYYVAR